jgi:predicted small lipoprotein YifL
MKKIFKWFIVIILVILAVPVLIILLSLFISIAGCNRSLPFEPTEIKSVTFYCVDPVFGDEDYEEYLPYIEPYSYRLSLEEAQMLFKETSPYFHVGWKGRPFLGIVELENGKRYDVAMGMGSVFMVLNGSISKYFGGESAALYRELSGELYTNCRPFFKSKRGLNQIEENLDILEKGGEYSLGELFGSGKDSLEINRQLSKIFQTSTNENGGNRFYTS